MSVAGSVVAGDLERVVELGQVLGLELDVEHGADDLDDLADVSGAVPCSHVDLAQG